MLSIRRILFAFTTNMVSLGRPAQQLPDREGARPIPPSQGSDRDEDVALAQAIARGDTDAFDVFYERHVDRLYHMIYCQLGAKQADAEDVLQESMMAALKALPHYRGDARLFTWLCAIAQHKITDHRRRTDNRGDSVTVPLENGHAVCTVDGEVQNIETHLLVRHALADLPDAHRQVLLLKYVQGLSVDEIAGVTGRSFKSVESLLSRAREGLREALDREANMSAQEAKNGHT